MAAERGIDIGVRRLRSTCEKGDRFDLHAALTISALRDVFIDPGSPNARTQTGPEESLDGNDLAARDRRNGRNAAAYGCAAHEHGARAALGDPAPEFRARHADQFAQKPEQRHVVFGYDHDRCVNDSGPNGLDCGVSRPKPSESTCGVSSPVCSFQFIRIGRRSLRCRTGRALQPWAQFGRKAV
jgi:hypothetical protein